VKGLFILGNSGLTTHDTPKGVQKLSVNETELTGRNHDTSKTSTYFYWESS